MTDLNICVVKECWFNRGLCYD